MACIALCSVTPCTQAMSYSSPSSQRLPFLPIKQQARNLVILTIHCGCAGNGVPGPQEYNPSLQQTNRSASAPTIRGKPQPPGARPDAPYQQTQQKCISRFTIE
jgi:hypothetical protein